MKMQFLLIGFISIALFGSTPVAVAHGHSGGGAGHGHGARGGHGRSAGGSHGHGHSAWGGHGRELLAVVMVTVLGVVTVALLGAVTVIVFTTAGAFSAWFWLLWLRLSVVVGLSGLSLRSVSIPILRRSLLWRHVLW